jgi:teichuronic acid exporter
MTLRQKALSGLGWTFTQQISVQVIRFVVSIILARMLTPQAFGVVGLLTVLVAVGNILIDGGLASSLIRKHDADHRDYSTVFIINFCVSVLIYISFFFAAPSIATFFTQPLLEDIVRVYCLSFIIRSFSLIQITRLTKEMNFKAQLVISVPSLIAGGLVGLTMAYLGFGVWSLVWMSLSENIINMVQYWVKSSWRPEFFFDRKLYRYHFNFGYKLTLVNLLEVLYKNLNQIVIGKFFSFDQLGFYSRAQSMKQLPVDSITTALNKVSYPLLSSIQEDSVRLKSVYKNLLQQVLFWVSPLMIFLGVLAFPLFRFLLTEKWLPAVPYFQMLCVVGLMYPLHTYNLNILNVKGRSDLFFRLEVIKKIIGVLTLVVAIRFGMIGLLWSEVILTFVGFFINAHYSGFLIGYTIKEQLRDIIPIIFVAAVAGCAVALIDWAMEDYHDLLRLVLSTAAGISFYFLASFQIKLHPMLEAIKIANSYRKR